MKKLLCLSAGIVALSVFCATAEEVAPPPVPDATASNAVKAEQKSITMSKPVLKEVTVTGTISQQEMKNKKGETVTMFIMKSDDGSTVRLPRSGKPDSPTAFKLEDYVGAKVKITGMGYEREHKGKTMIGLQKIMTIDKVVDSPAAAPAAAPAK
jgi:hypothetical protein